MRYDHLTLGKLGKVETIDAIVDLQKYFSQTGLSDRVILEVELVESVERVLVSMHVERVDGKIICTQFE